MATRPWITPADVKAYSDLKDVTERSEAKLTVDIKRAEAYIIKYCGHDFSAEKYDVIPDDIKTADIILSEYYAHKQGSIGKMKSESFDDWSYTSSESEYLIQSLGIDVLLDPYVETKASGKINMRLRRL
ncbi:MAG: DUF3199 family protein [Eubacterium sp.]|nr:DUF3199 family protein [Eubacterium sp.]